MASSADNARKLAETHKQQGKGMSPPSSFKSDTERKAYQATYNNTKKK